MRFSHSVPRWMIVGAQVFVMYKELTCELTEVNSTFERVKSLAGNLRMVVNDLLCETINKPFEAYGSSRDKCCRYDTASLSPDSGLNIVM
jgi:hypothetical protein